MRELELRSLGKLMISTLNGEDIDWIHNRSINK
jgi:hypothetical protein